jgi:hypothetical protein
MYASMVDISNLITCNLGKVNRSKQRSTICIISMASRYQQPHKDYQFGKIGIVRQSKLKMEFFELKSIQQSACNE